MKHAKNLFRFALVALIGLMTVTCQKDATEQAEMPDFGRASAKVLKNGIVYCGDPVLTALKADQLLDVGSVTIGNDAENLYITITTTGDWMIANAKIWIGENAEDLPVNKSGNPVRGKFTFDEDQGPDVQSLPYPFPFAGINEGVMPGSTVYIAVHADVKMEYMESGEIMVREETAWAEGMSIGGKAWGWYLEYTLQECSEWQCGDPFTDTRDGNEYSTVQIGEQCWFSENLAWLPEVIGPGVGSETDPLYYVYGYGGTDVATAKGTVNYDIYGVLYNWPAAVNACPDGWHQASDGEWTVLTDYLTNNNYGYGGTGSDIGKSMASTSGWTSSSEAGGIGNNQVDNNSSGFNAVPGGYRLSDGGFYNLGDYAYFWSSTENGSAHAWYRGLGYYFDGVVRYFWYRSHGFSVRCLLN